MGEYMISVILPVYNAEKFIGRALDSLMAQTYTDFEVIVVDDGSIDRSFDIVHKYVKRDPRITGLHLDHQGVGATRNQGIEHSNGDLFFFMDADDYLLPNALETLYNGYLESGVPIVVGGVFRQSPQGEAYRFNSPTGFDAQRQILDKRGIADCVWRYIHTNDCYLVSHCWGRLYAKSIIDKVRFDEIMRIGEDGVFNIQCLFYADRVMVINEPLYCFQVHGASSAINSTKKYLVRDLNTLHATLDHYFLGHVRDFISTLTSATEDYAEKQQPETTNYSMLTPKDVLLARIKASKKPVIIYGADVVGKVLLDICTEAGIKVVAFCDYNPKLTGRYGLPIYHPVHDAIYIISVLSIKNVVGVLQGKEWYAGGILLDGINTLQDGCLIDTKKYQVESCRISHAAFLKKDYVFLRSLDIMITERCSLKCKDCSNLMQYFKNPKDFDLDKVISEVDALLENVDEILEARVLGGDAFMHKRVFTIIEHLVKSNKIRRVVVYTNGVIIPKMKGCEVLAQEKVIVSLTDYGVLSENIDEIIDLLGEYRIKYIVTKPEVWLDCATIHKHYRTQEQNDALFKGCVATSLTTMVDGKVFRCPFSASTYLLGYDFPADYEEVNSPKLWDHLTYERALNICDYCTSRILTNTIKPAIQINKPLEYEGRQK
jgi:glycosyltransferase involved in cell wall biosynthesis